LGDKVAKLSLFELLEAIKATSDLMTKALNEGDSGEAKRLVGVLDYLVGKAIEAEKQHH
jgi:hypothetical protein